MKDAAAELIEDRRFPGVFVHRSSFVEDGVLIGTGTKIWHFCHILSGTVIGKDCSIGQNVMIGPRVRVGDGCKIQNNVSLYEGVELGPNVFCGPSCVFTNVNAPRANVSRKHEFAPTPVGEGVTIGANATIVCGHSLGAWSMIGAGSVVTRDVPEFALVVGNPARQVGWVARSGDRLGSDLVCPRIGERYVESAGRLLPAAVSGDRVTDSTPRLSYLMSITPRESWRLLRRRLPILRNGRAWTAEELLSSSKHGRGIRFAELLLRQEAVVRRHVPWEPLDFSDRRVVEIGCGPLAGFGPLAIFCGAASFESAEPEWDPQLFHSELVSDRYLRAFHADLSALYGPRMDFAAFRQALRERLSVHRCGFEVAPLGGSADIVLSQSCLEHVFPLESTAAKLASIQNVRTRFLHLVDFGNHYPTGNPFEGLYDQPPADYLARRGKAINLLRAPDVQSLFTRQGIPAQTVASRSIAYSGAIHPWWRERYDEAALFTQLALVIGPAA